MILWNYIKSKMLSHPDQTLCEENASITYSELCAFAESYAQKLNGAYYGILCRSELAETMALLACIAAGKTAIPMPSRYGKEAYLKILDRADPPYVICDIDGELIPMYMSPKKEYVFQINAPAAILFTSGSTGTPKGVMLSEENLISNVRDISSYLSIDETDTVLISRPIYHSSVLTGELLVALCNGAKIVFTSEQFQPLNILNILKREKITVFGSTPTLLSTLSKFVRNADELYVKKLTVSGECITYGMAKDIRKAFPYSQVYCGYGLTEASPRVAYLPPELFDKVPTAAGIPLPSVRIDILKAKSGDDIGELIVKGPNIMCGYFDDTDRTENVIKDGWLRTGDLATFGDDGLLYIKGRRDDMIIRAGMNIYPAEIENVLSEDDRIESVLAYGYEYNGTQQIGLTVCGAFSSTKEIMQLCREKLPSYQIPSKIDIVEKNETLSGGKKKRKIN